MPQRHRSDPGQGSVPPRYPGTFLLALREAVAALGWRECRLRGPLAECLEADGKEHVVGLDNLYRRCRQSERADWPALVTEFLRTVAEADRLEDVPKDLASVADRVLVRLCRRQRGPSPADDVWSQALVGTDLELNLVIDYPNRMAFVTKQLIAESGQTGADWLERALTNLRARTPHDCLELLHDDTNLLLCALGDSYDSSRALVLSSLLPDCSSDGCFVSVPGRDQLLVLEIDADALAQVHLMKVFAMKTFRSVPYPISEEIYWVQGDVWRLFPVEVQGERVTVQPPEEFLEILRRLVPQDESADAKEEGEPPT